MRNHLLLALLHPHQPRLLRLLESRLGEMQCGVRSVPATKLAVSFAALIMLWVHYEPGTTVRDCNTRARER